MKSLTVFLFPLWLSALLYIVSAIFSFDYCGFVIGGLEFLRFSGVDYLGDGVVDCILYGSLLIVVVFFIPYLFLICFCMDDGRLELVRGRVNVKEGFFAGCFIFFLCLFLFFVEFEYGASRYARFMALVYEYDFMFYVFLLFQWQVVAGIWALCLKLKLNR